MRYVTDDFTQSYSQDIAWTPAQIADAVSLQDPLINAEIESMLHSASMQGVDLSDPVAMSGIVEFFMDKIKQAGNAITGGQPVSIQTTKGTTTIGPEGVSYTSSTPATTTAPGAVQKPLSQTIQEYLKNPYVLAGVIGIPVLLIIMNRRKRRKRK